MHEMALCESILQIIEEEASKKAFSKVTGIYLDIGQFSCVEPAALKFCFEVVSKTTLAELASININTIPGKGWCRNCLRDIPLSHRFSPCPVCNNRNVIIRQGEEMLIKQLEVA
ncbi:hydrogenase maturation nickel metallochaperone HypA [Aestuariibacter salexigens]|uniref:hydrogenase maturation nickel metallochaperone HypA n=1 Tax=Aestuariibacter salexigens TaxID=226010 RepID=UPI0004799DC8|nr:hydrogenase maturation nickel metallochaperone HypA [Aestuariibacter salexigens]